MDMREMERSSLVDTALASGKLDKDIVSSVDAFCERHNFKKSMYVDELANPGVKSSKSLVSKLTRKYEIEEDKNFSLTDTGDIIRCSIMVESYAEALPLIRELRKSIPGLKGDISENSTGYKGIHLSFEIDGYKAEMQIATRDMWYAKQAGEEVYSRWRDFNQNQLLSEIINAEGEERREKAKKFLDDLDLKMEQEADCAKIFNQVQRVSDFEEYKKEINAALLINKDYEEERLPEEILNKYSVKKDGSLSDEELMNRCEKFAELAKPRQEKLINIASKAVEVIKIISIGEESKKLTHDEKVFMISKDVYHKVICKQLEERYGEQFQEDKYISVLNKITNSEAFDIAKYCKKNDIKISSKDDLFNVINQKHGNETENIFDIEIKKIDKIADKIERDIKNSLKVKEIGRNANIKIV